MNVPFTVYLEVKQINNNNPRDQLLITEYPINLTLKHKIGDIKHSIWIHSQDYALKPLFLTIRYHDRKLSEDERLCDILQTQEVPPEPIYKEFELIIDCTLFGSPAVPRRDPVEELFDIIVEWEDSLKRLNTIRIRESLDCTVGVVKDYLVDERNKSGGGGQIATRDSFNLTLKSTGEVFRDDDLRLSTVLKLDVTPLHPVVFRLSLDLQTSNSDTSSMQQNLRFHIKIESNVDSLQEGANLFEINNSTTVQEFKQHIIDRIDYQSVRRTFMDQIVLYYQTQLIDNMPTINNSPLYNVLLLNENILNESNKIISMTLEVAENSNGIFSREFWTDLRSDDRFEFLPNTNNELPDGGSQEHQSSRENILPIEPTKIVLESGVEWNLVGDAFERIQSNQNTLPNIDHNTPTELLVNQSELSPIDYEFTLMIGDEIKTASLNTSQCIIVDKGNHQPYLLLSPSGASKLYKTFKSPNEESLIQQVQVLLYNETSSSNNRNFNVNTINHNQSSDFNANNDDDMGSNLPINIPPTDQPRIIDRAFEFARNNLQRGVSILLKYVFIIYMLGLDSLLLKFWRQILGFGLICGTIYILFFAGNRVADGIEVTFFPNNTENDLNRPTRIDIRILRGLIRVLRFTNTVTANIMIVIKNELISTAIKRTRDYDFFLEARSWWFLLTDNLNNLWKDLLLLILTLFPSLHDEIYEELKNWRNNEINELEGRVKLYHELVLTLIEEYNSKFTPNFAMPDKSKYDTIQRKLDSTLLDDNAELIEKRYRLLIEFYKNLENAYVILNKSFISNIPYTSDRGHQPEEPDHQEREEVINLDDNEPQSTGVRIHHE